MSCRDCGASGSCAMCRRWRAELDDARLRLAIVLAASMMGWALALGLLIWTVVPG